MSKLKSENATLVNSVKEITAERDGANDKYYNLVIKTKKLEKLVQQSTAIEQPVSASSASAVKAAPLSTSSAIKRSIHATDRPTMSAVTPSRSAVSASSTSRPLILQTQTPSRAASQQLPVKLPQSASKRSAVDDESVENADAENQQQRKRLAAGEKSIAASPAARSTTRSMASIRQVPVVAVSTAPPVVSTASSAGADENQENCQVQ